jgi:hypothetical protein
MKIIKIRKKYDRVREKTYGLMISVVEPETVERQHFAGATAGAKFFWLGFGSGYVNSYKMLQKP